jgi:hypothetical protein
VRGVAVTVAALLLVAMTMSAASTRTAAASIYRVPARIDATGRRDVSQELNQFIRSVPNGSVIRFRAKGVYRLQGRGIELRARRNLVLNGNGATLRSSGCESDDSVVKVWSGSSNVVVRRFRLVGSNPNAGTSRAHRAWCQHQHGVGVYGSFDTTIENVDIRRTNGDCLYVGEGTRSSGTYWSNGVVFRDSVCRRSGRMGVAVVAGRDIQVTRVRFYRTGMYVFDIEPNNRAGGAANVRFRNNRIGRFTVDTTWDPYLFSANGASGDGIVRNVTVARNRVMRGSLRSVSDVPTRHDIVFRNNVSRVRARGPVLDFQYVRGLVVTGNVQPLRSGPLASIRDSSGVTYRP